MKYPIGIQSFEKIRLDEYAYVDKTALVYQLANTGSYYFLSRPHRFGKSLLISTLEAYFNGQRELFKGLAIEKLEQDWTKYPILHLDLNTGKYDEKQSLADVESFKDNPIAVIYQSGYLTIKGYEEEFDIYRLGFPNKEVAEGFINYLIPYYMPVKDNESVYFISKFIADVRTGNPDQFMKRLATMFSDTDYKIVGNAELYFQNAFFIVMRMLGFYTKVERPTSESRMDMVIETKDYVYIVEFKLNAAPEEALKQIEEKGYAKPFAMDSRKLYRIGVNLSLEKRCIDGWIID